MKTAAWWLSWIVPFWLAALPASGSYQLNSYGFGNGGAANSTSTNYAINGSAGEVAGSSSSTNYKAGSGENSLKQADVPLVTLSNPLVWYNKLKLNIDPQTNPSDAKFAVAISTDGFTTTQYVKSDLTVGTTLTFSDYRTYAGWGSGAGVVIRGLHPNSVYTAKAKAYRGKFTESAYGPTSSAILTDIPQLAVDIDVAATDMSTSPPYIVSFGSLLPGSVVDSPVRIWVSFATNAENGGKVFANGLNSGLLSASTSYTIPAVTGDLSSLTEGFGAQGVTATQSADGPFTLTSPYDGSASNVGILDSTIRELFSSPGPVTGGRGSIILKSKAQTQTAAANDFSEVLTVIASANF